VDLPSQAAVMTQTKYFTMGENPKNYTSCPFSPFCLQKNKIKKGQNIYPSYPTKKKKSRTTSICNWVCGAKTV
jgi:hypothetical protein